MTHLCSLAAEFISSSFKRALPTSCLSTFHSAYQHCFPGGLCRKYQASIEYDGTIIQEERVSQEFLNQKFTFNPDISDEKKEELIQNFSAEIEGQLHQRLDEITRIAQHFGIQKLRFTLSLPDKTNQLEPTYKSIGDTTSFSPPILEATPKKEFTIQSEEEIQSEGDETPEEAYQAKQFAIVHELVRISKNHSKVRTCFELGMATFNLALWAYAMTGPRPLWQRTLLTLKDAFIFQSIFSLVYFAECRQQMRIADLLALEAFDSNEEGLAFLASDDVQEGCSFEPKERRLDYFTGWQPMQQRV